MVEKRLQKVAKKVANREDVKPKITEAEAEVIHLLTDEFLTPKQVAIRRKTSTQFVYKIIKNLKKKGLIDRAYNKVAKSQSTLQPCNQIRLHGQEFNIKILYKDQRYKELLNKANTLNVDGNTIRLYRDSIEVYSGISFYADDVDKATARSMDYWNRFFRRLEHDLKLILVKPRYQNIRLVNQHYAEINNELAEECEKKAYKIRVYATDDGKLWFTIDNSFNLHEAETQHPGTAKQDMGDVVKPFFNDLRDKEHIPLSKISQYMADTSHQVNEISHGVKALADYLQSQIPKKPEDNGIDRKIKPEYIG